MVENIILNCYVFLILGYFFYECLLWVNLLPDDNNFEGGAEEIEEGQEEGGEDEEEGDEDEKEILDAEEQ